MKHTSDELIQKKREFGQIFFYSVAGVFLFYILLGVFTDDIVIVPIEILSLAFFFTVYTGFLMSKTKFDFLVIFRILIILLAVFVIYISLLLSNISQAIFFIFVPITLAVMLLFSFRASVVSAFFFLIISYFISEISAQLGIALDKEFYRERPHILVLQEYIAHFIAVYFSFFILYYKNEFFKIELQQNLINTIKEETQESPLEQEDEEENFEDDETEEDDSFINTDKYQHLYDRIISSLENDKLYQDPDFNIRKLAVILDSNSTYVSRALNKIGDKKFNQLVNDYRIEQVKTEIKNKMHLKFTIEHIYRNAGFSQQSTFNRIFKEHTGFTPSDYIRTQS